MLRKFNIVVVTNLIFYFFIFVHRIVLKTYGDDYILQAVFYMALSFSILLEESYRKEIKKLRIISLIDFILRTMVLVVHFMYLVFNWDIYIVNLITVILFLCEVIFKKKLSYMRISVCVVSCVTFLPTLNRKYKIK